MIFVWQAPGRRARTSVRPLSAECESYKQGGIRCVLQGSWIGTKGAWGGNGHSWLETQGARLIFTQTYLFGNKEAQSPIPSRPNL